MFCVAATPAGALFDMQAPGAVQIVDPSTANATPFGTVAHPFNVQGTVTDTGSVLGFSSQYPATSVPETISATGTTTAFTATLPVGTALQTVYICGVEIDAAATAATAVVANITGTISGTLNFLEYVSAIASPGNGHAIIFSPCIPASAVNTPIVVHAGAAGTAGVAAISAWGYLL